MVIFISLVILLGVLSLLYFLVMLRLKNRIYNTLINKMSEYKENGRVVFCYVDDEFGFKNDVYRYIEVSGDMFIVRGKKYNISEVKDVMYKLDNFNFKLRDSVYIKIMFDVISDIYKIDSLYIRTDYVISFVLMLDLIKKMSMLSIKNKLRNYLRLSRIKL